MNHDTTKKKYQLRKITMKKRERKRDGERERVRFPRNVTIYI